MIWQLWVIIGYAIVNLALSTWYLGSQKELKVTFLSTVLTALWYSFIIWTIVGLL